MSFSTIRNIATSSLMATSVQVSLTSSNIANADVEGYTRKMATQVATVTAGAGAGTTITGITSKVDKYLVKALVEVDLRRSAPPRPWRNLRRSPAEPVRTDLRRRRDRRRHVARQHPRVAGDGAHQSRRHPEGESLQAAVVDQFEAARHPVARDLAQHPGSAGGGRRLDRGRDLRRQRRAGEHLRPQPADHRRAGARRLHRRPGGQAQHRAADRRRQDGRDVLHQLRRRDVRLFSVGAAAGRHKLPTISYVAAGGVTSATVFNAITVDGKDITASITSGEIGALIDQRDNLLPAAQDELDELAAKLIDAINAVHNQGTSLPRGGDAHRHHRGGRGAMRCRQAAPCASRWSTRMARCVGYSDLDLSTLCDRRRLWRPPSTALPACRPHFNAAGHLVVGARRHRHRRRDQRDDQQRRRGRPGDVELLRAQRPADRHQRDRHQCARRPAGARRACCRARRCLRRGDADGRRQGGDQRRRHVRQRALRHADRIACLLRGRAGWAASSTSFASYAADIIADVAAISQREDRLQDGGERADQPVRFAGLAVRRQHRRGDGAAERARRALQHRVPDHRRPSTRCSTRC